MNLKSTPGSDIERQSGKLKYLLTVLLLTLTFVVQAQGWEFSFGGDKEDQGTAILQTVDRGILEVGFSESFGDNNDIDIYAVRTDVDGTLIWERTYDEGFIEQAFEVIPVGEDGFLIVGFLQPEANTPAHAYLLRIDNRGAIIWSQLYNNAGFDQRAQDIEATSDGGYILVGTTQTSDPDMSDVLLIKVDADGQEQWRNQYDTDNRSERGVGVVETPTGYMLAANVKSATSFTNDIGLYIINADGTQQGGTVIYGNSENEEVKDLIYTEFDNNVVFVGSTQNSNHALVAKADLNGGQLWYQEIDFGAFDDVLNGVIEEQTNGKLTAVGQTLPTAVNVDVLFVQLDASGIVELQTNIGDDDVLNTGEDIALTYDGGYVIAGYNAKSAVFFNDLTIFKINGTARHLTNEISGKAFTNINGLCGPLQINSRGLSDWQVRAEKPGRVFYASTDADGNYKMLVDTGIYNLSLVLRNEYWAICDSEGFSINFNDLYETEDFDFSVKPIIDKPLLEVNVSTPVLNICEEAEYTVHYCNLGPKSALNTQVDIILDQELAFVGSSIENDSISMQDSLLNIRLGTITSQECGSFTIRTQVACDNILPQQAITVSAAITPSDPAEPYDGPSIEVSATCVNIGGSNEIRFVIKNVGDFDISEPAKYIVVEDQIIHLNGEATPLEIPVGGSMALPAIPSEEGGTYRLITQQADGHPGRSMPTVAIEGCTDETTYSTGFFAEFPENDNDPFIDIDVQEVIESGSSVVLKGHPKGYQDSIITAITDLEYLLVFENTGNDTIDRIVIRDTLPSQLDLSTLEMGPSSHPYEYELYDGGILKITFAEIQLLPDGGGGEAISQGFVKFRLSQKPNNPLGTVISNRAAVFFDYHVPQSTNVEHRIVGCIDFLNVEEACILVDIDTPEPNVGLEIKVFPNPFNETATFELIGCTTCQELELEIFDVLGRRVRLDRPNAANFQFERKDLPAGAYWFSLRSSGKLLSSGKMIITQ